MAAALTLETLAAHKLVPIIVPAEKEFHARWLPVLDSPKDAARLKQLEEAMPAVCRAALTPSPSPKERGEQSPKSLLNSFLNTFCDSLAREWGKSAAPEFYEDSSAASWIKALFSENARIQLTAPFILRRVKTDPRVISDLPDKVETKVYCTLTEEQATLYEAVVQDVMKKIEEEEGIKRRGLVLSMMMQLKQICNHPVQYLHQKSKSGADVSLDNRSGKLERLGELLEEVLADNDRALIFTQFAEMGEMLADYLPKAFGAATQFLHGGTSAKMRDQMVKRFQEDEHAPPIFILSLKAGGTGLNLTRANHVFHFDRWWNPAVEKTATYARVQPWVRRWGGWAVLVLSAIPNPFFDLACVAAGTLKMPVWKFLAFCWVGQTIKMALFAYAGAASLNLLFNH